ncbi:MAG: GDSL-type esterase/lipase family protein [Acidaminococcales bacterium]|jgi:lysophospholipase L1-like esterase|nr:GDSL-type esterase/lipase family protein [Acidaminococcales bacterium]
MLLAVLGDSLTAGFPFGEKVSWLSVLSERLGVKSLNYGVCGETTADMKFRAKRILENGELTHFIMFGGANDVILAARAASDIARDTAAIQKMALDRKLRVGCVLPLVSAAEIFAGDFMALRDSVRGASLPGVLTIDLQKALPAADNPLNYLDDGVHLTVRGNEALGLYAARLLKDWLRE